MTDYQCPLGRLQPERPDPEQVKRRGWRQQKILVVRLDDERLGWMEKEFVRQLGEKLYGEGRGDNGND